MKIVVISSLYDVNGGGAGIMAHHLAHGLSTKGNRVAVITMGTSRQFAVSQEQDVKIYRFRPWNIYPFEEKDTHPPWQKLFWQALDIYNFHSAGVLRLILEKESPDIVHIHKMRGFSGATWSVAARLFPGRVIQTCHDYESMSPDGLLRGSIGRMAVEKRWPIRGYQLLRARLSAQVSILTAPSAFTLKRVVESGLFPFARSRVIPNTHGWSRDKIISMPQKMNVSIRFLFLGRLEVEKGILELCEAFLRAYDSHPSMQLDIAGWGTLENILRQKYGTHPGINFLGSIHGKSKEDALSSTAIVVVPSLVEEVFGLVAVEAFAFGKPVIASNIGGLPELVRHGETGWLVEAGNIQALSEQLKSVAKMDTLFLKNVSRTCKEFSYEFSIEKALAEYEHVYQQLIQ